MGKVLYFLEEWLVLHKMVSDTKGAAVFSWLSGYVVHHVLHYHSNKIRGTNSFLV